MAAEQHDATLAESTRLVIADVDGTLVTHEKVLTPRAIDAVFALRAAGIKFAVTSGRPPHGMDMLVEPLKLDEPIAAFNGGVITVPGQSAVLRENFLLPEVVRQTVQLIMPHHLDAWLYTDTTWFVRDVSAPHVAREQWTVKFPPTLVHDFGAALEHASKIVGVSDDLALVAGCEKDAQTALGGNPYDNRFRWYFGSSDDLRLNLHVQRFAASPAARFAVRNYETNGHLRIPMVTLHTTGDPITPVWHELLYFLKADTFARAEFIPLPIARYGHCNFTTAELLFAFSAMR